MFNYWFFQILVQIPVFSVLSWPLYFKLKYPVLWYSYFFPLHATLGVLLVFCFVSFPILSLTFHQNAQFIVLLSAVSPVPRYIRFIFIRMSVCMCEYPHRPEEIVESSEPRATGT